MPIASSTSTADRATWQVGQRVSRKHSQDLGSVVKTNGAIKVRWDAGRTSYFRHGKSANVKLEQVPVEE